MRLELVVVVIWAVTVIEITMEVVTTVWMMMRMEEVAGVSLFYSHFF